MLDYYRPDNLNDGLVALSEYPWTLLAGGTDFYPARVGKHLNEKVMDLTGIRELRSIRETGVEIHLGALTTWTDVVKAKLPRAFDGLKKAVKTIGGVQTQNAGTICGNICNASPAADSVPNLMALDAKVGNCEAECCSRCMLRGFSKTELVGKGSSRSKAQGSGNQACVSGYIGAY